MHRSGSHTASPHNSTVLAVAAFRWIFRGMATGTPTYVIVTHVAAAPADVFRFLSVPENHRRINASVSSVTKTAEEQTWVLSARHQFCCVSYNIRTSAVFHADESKQSVEIQAAASGVRVRHVYSCATGSLPGTTSVAHEVFISVPCLLRCFQGYTIRTARSSHEAADKELGVLPASAFA